MNADFATIVASFATSLALGLLVGLERERHPGAKAGVRTFALVALAGTLAAMVAELASEPLVIVAGLALITVLIASAFFADPSTISADFGTTSVVAAIVVNLLGVVVWYGHVGIASALAIATTALLFLKPELEGFSKKLNSRDVTGTLQFAVLALVILPLAPDIGYGPYGALNPYHMWLMVVLVAGVSWAGYVAWRLVPSHRGLAVAGLLGGLVSTTATTLVFARHARTHPALTETSAGVILLANLVPPVRLAVILAAAAPALVPVLAPMLIAAFIAALPAALAPFLPRWRRAGGDASAAQGSAPEFSNPANFTAALGFGLAYGVVLLASAWLTDVAGDRGLLAIAFASGLVDIDAISLSSARLAVTEAIPYADAARAIGIAYIANLGVKLGIAAIAGGMPLARRAALGLVPAAVAIGLVLIWLPAKGPGG